MARRLGFVLLASVASSCGGAVDDPAPIGWTAQPVVIHGRLEGETVDCGLSGWPSCYHDSLAREVWLLPRAASARCHETYPQFCSPADRRPLAVVIASKDGDFRIATVEGEYRLAVVYRNTLRPAWDDHTNRTGKPGDDVDGFLLTAGRFADGELFHFAGDP